MLNPFFVIKSPFASKEPFNSFCTILLKIDKSFISILYTNSAFKSNKEFIFPSIFTLELSFIFATKFILFVLIKKVSNLSLKSFCFSLKIFSKSVRLAYPYKVL